MNVAPDSQMTFREWINTRRPTLTARGSLIAAIRCDTDFPDAGSIPSRSATWFAAAHAGSRLRGLASLWRESRARGLVRSATMKRPRRF